MPERDREPSQPHAWLQLLRVPNLFTVPGDPLAGFLLASGGAPLESRPLFAVIAASLCVYAAGLLVNDVADVVEDAEERPDRPLPSGRVRPEPVITAATLLALGALGLTFVLGQRVFLACLALVFSVLLYDLGLKRFPLIGPLNMGLCRALSLLMGAVAAVGSDKLSKPAIVATVLVGVYIAAVTQMARSETRAKQTGPERWFPFLILLAGGILFGRVAGLYSVLSWVGYVGAYALALMASFIVGLSLSSLLSVGSQHEDHAMRSIPSLIGLLVSSLIFLQAAFVMAAGYGRSGAIIGLVLLAVWPVSRIMSRRYYAS